MEGGMTKRPDEIVAENIAGELQKNNLISEDKVNEFTRKLSNGSLSIEDWKLMAELAVEESKGGQNGQKA
jgi:hypothetical protein